MMAHWWYTVMAYHGIIMYEYNSFYMQYSTSNEFSRH